MKQLFFQPENAWVGDLIPYYENGTYYAFYLHDPRLQKGVYAAHTTWHLVTTKDFTNLEYHGEAIKRGSEKDPNLNAYTGSVIKDKDGIYHVFYTAFNEAFKTDGKAIQSVMQATGRDLYHLETVPKFLFQADGVRYEHFDWRDPFVFFNEEDQCYWMVLAARKCGSGALRGGCLALAKSSDLYNWTYSEPFFAPDMYITMECPEIFRWGDWWYLVFSTFSDEFKTHYRIAKSVNGPWIIPENDTFDCRADYAIKTAGDGKRRFAFGWIASKEDDRDFGAWEWAGTMVAHELVQNPENGELSVRPIEALRKYYGKKSEGMNPITWKADYCPETRKLCSQMLGALLVPVPKDRFRMELDFTIEKAARFGIALHVPKDLETGYFLKMDRKTNNMTMDLWPRSEKGKEQWQIKGDIPCQIETLRPLPEGKNFRVTVLREGSICVVYVNDQVVMSTRTYDHKGKMAGIFLVQGEATIDRMEIFQ